MPSFGSICIGIYGSIDFTDLQQENKKGIDSALRFKSRCVMIRKAILTEKKERL